MTVMPHVGSEALAEKYKTAKRTGDIYLRFYVLIYLATWLKKHIDERMEMKVTLLTSTIFQNFSHV